MHGKMTLVNSPARVLVVGQLIIGTRIRDALPRGRYRVQSAVSAAEAIAALGDWQPHLNVIDFDRVQGRDRDQLLAAAPGCPEIPVVALTRGQALATKLAAFDLGVDDVQTIPFHTEELAARIQAILRRTYHDVVAFTPALRIGELEINIHDRVVRIGDEDLHLTAIEQNLLYLLAANSGYQLTRGEILDALWGPDYTADSNVVDRHIRNLRLKLHDDPHRPRYIVTVPGTGYQFLPVTTGHEPERLRPEAAGPRANHRGPDGRAAVARAVGGR